MRFVRGTIPGFEAEGERDIAVIEGDANLGTWTEQNRRLDNERDLLNRLAKHITSESVVYDLGANIGDHTAYFASLRPRQVVAWEAYPDAFECLSYNLDPYHDWKQLKGWTQLILMKRPIGNGEAVALSRPVDISYENKGARTVRDVREGEALTRTDRIDDLVAGRVILPPTFMKLDIEGWECHALRGGWETIKKHRPMMLCEVGRHLLVAAGNSPEELHSMLTELGYSLHDLDGNPWLPGDPRTGFDILATVE